DARRRSGRLRSGRLQAELFKADVDDASHLAFFLSPGLARTPTRSRIAGRRTTRLRRTRLVPVLAFERMPKALQLQNQGGTLRSQFAAAVTLDRAALVPVEIKCVRLAPHGYTRSATAAR